MDMVAVCIVGYLHADYWITDGGDFAKHRDFCKHTMAWDVVQRTGLPQFASTSLAVIRRHVEERDRDMIAAARMAEMDAEEDGRCFMDELDPSLPPPIEKKRAFRKTPISQSPLLPKPQRNETPCGSHHTPKPGRTGT